MAPTVRRLTRVDGVPQRYHLVDAPPRSAAVTPPPVAAGLVSSGDVSARVSTATTVLAGGPLRVVMFRDEEGDGTCQACGRDGLRWIAVLSDGSHVGTECGKRVLGYKPAPRSYQWVADYEPVAELTDEVGQALVLWRHRRNPNAAARSTNGLLTATGPMPAMTDEWEREVDHQERVAHARAARAAQSSSPQSSSE